MEVPLMRHIQNKLLVIYSKLALVSNYVQNRKFSVSYSPTCHLLNAMGNNHTMKLLFQVFRRMT